jgi:DNA-binding transcriptional LysR family regulator
MISYSELACFVCMVEELDYKVAEKKLCLKQAKIAKNIVSLEKKVGFILFDRSVKPMKVTDLGEKLYLKSVYILNEMKALNDFEFLSEEESNKSNKIKIGIPHTLNSSLAPYFVENYDDEDFSLDIVNGWGKSLLTLLTEKEIDLTITLLPTENIPEDGNKWYLLGKVPLVIVCRKEVARLYKNLTDCNHTGWILNPEGCGFRVMLNEAINKKGLKLFIKNEVFGTEEQLALVEDYKGIGLVPRPFFEYYNEVNNNLTTLCIKEFQPAMYICLVAQKDITENSYLSIVNLMNNRFKLNS